ncbi:hypothetical protein GCM10023188_11890 [Pontibacter saemangeumensis]|uniref:DUF2382 domain-containing protein n=1 Tax=Pontibacter saemangeumensis TaxID=1084525 RepID=A0ABP8LFU8_9BACT
MKGQTVIGIFDYGVDAQMAAQKLMSNGIPESKIDVAVRGATDRHGNPLNKATTPNTATTNRTDTTPGTRNDKDTGFFESLFDNKDESIKYSEVAQHGSIVAVHTQSDEEAKRAAELLDKYGAIDVDDRAEKYKKMPREERNKWINSSIPVVQEEMKVGKREVETGGVRVRSRIVEKPVEEHLRLREEHVHVERQPVNRPATEKDFATFKSGETEIIEHAEVPLVSKEARVVEEVKLGKETTTRDETVRETVRKTDVDINEIDAKRNNSNSNDVRNQRNK